METNIKMTDLISVEDLQRIQDTFSEMTGMSSITTDVYGTPITQKDNMMEFCYKYTRETPLGCERCEACDRYGMQLAFQMKKSIAYECHAGLVDFAAPIKVNDKLIGCILGGQVLIEPYKEEKVRETAKELGIDPEKYIESVKKIKVKDKEEIEKAANCLSTIANILSDIAYSRYKVIKASEEIEKAAKLKVDFLANMSHEIRTPMNAVIGMAEMALREDLSENARQYISEIKTAGKSLLTIINDILDFSKIEAGKMDIVPVEYEPMSLVHDITNIVVTRLVNKNVEFMLDIDTKIPSKLYGDNDRIKQIILNIVNNAVKYTSKGRIIVRFGFRQDSPKVITLVVSVEDTGMGIKKADLDKLFDSFRQLDSKRNRNVEGTGLGLTICKQLLTLMGGEISVESEYEKGSNFTVEIPQQVIDNTESISLKKNDNFVVAAFFSSEYMKEQLIQVTGKFGIPYIAIENAKELQHIQDKGVTHLLIESDMLVEEVKEVLDQNADITPVLVVGYQENVTCDIPNMVVMKKPISTLNLAMILNEEHIHYEQGEQNKYIFDFEAPEAEVLIVDDNPVNLTVAVGLLEPLKMKIETATSGKEAIDKISNKVYDIVFMDHMMPELDGVETTHIIREFHAEYAGVPIIALTANAVDGTMEMFLKEGMNDFVAKPIELRILILKVKRWLPTEKIKMISMNREGEQSEENVCLPEIGDLDVKMAVERLGSEKLFWNVLRDYYRVIEQKCALIKGYEEAENWSAYTIEVHALKSASMQIGANRLADMAANLEKAGNAKDAETIRAKTEFMLEQYKGYASVLKPYFVENQKKKVIKQAITSEKQKELFAKLQVGLDDLDMDIMGDVVEEMHQYQYNESQKELFEQLQEAVDNIDIEYCEEIIREWEKLD